MEIATRRQGIMHEALFLPTYPGNSTLIVLSQQHRLVPTLHCTEKQGFHRYPCPHLPGHGGRWEDPPKELTAGLTPGKALVQVATHCRRVVCELQQLPKCDPHPLDKPTRLLPKIPITQMILLDVLSPKSPAKMQIQGKGGVVEEKSKQIH